jgi:hypothetical protein
MPQGKMPTFLGHLAIGIGIDHLARKFDSDAKATLRLIFLYIHPEFGAFPHLRLFVPISTEAQKISFYQEPPPLAEEEFLKPKNRRGNC